MPIILVRNGKNYLREEWYVPIEQDACKPLLPTVLKARAHGRVGGLRGPAIKRAMTVARRLIPLKGDR